MKKYIFNFLLFIPIILGSFLIGNQFPIKIDKISDIFKVTIDDFRVLQPNFAKIRVCNYSGINIDSINIGESVYFGIINSGTCTSYSKIDVLYKYISARIYTIEGDNERYLYSITPIDMLGVKKISFGEHTININELNKNTGAKIINYYRSIGYTIQ